jgi:hypothetical protein
VLANRPVRAHGKRIGNRVPCVFRAVHVVSGI